MPVATRRWLHFYIRFEPRRFERLKDFGTPIGRIPIDFDWSRFFRACFALRGLLEFLGKQRFNRFAVAHIARSDIGRRDDLRIRIDRDMPLVAVKST